MTVQTQKTGFRKKYIGDRAFYAMIFAVAVPIMIQQGITSLVNMLDNVMVGRIGTEQMSGVSIVNQFYSIYMVSMFGGVSGAGIFTAQYCGNKDWDGVRNTFRYKFWVAVLLTVLAILILKLFGPQLISLYLNDTGDSGDLQATLTYAMQYLEILVFLFPAFGVLQVYASTLRENGDTRVPMVAGLVAIFTNLVLNWVLIFGNLGFPVLGVRGAAIATVIARYTEAAIVVIFAHRRVDRHPYIRGLYRTLLLPFRLIKLFFIKGFPLLLNEVLWSVANSTLLQCYSLRGLNAIAAFYIANTLSQIFAIVIMAMGNAVAIIVGQKLGANALEEAKDIDTKIIFTSVLSGVVTGLLMASFAAIFPHAYNTNAEARALATEIILIYALFQPVHAFYNATYFTLRAGGKTVITFLFDGFYSMVINVPIAFVLSRFTGLPMPGILLSVSCADFLKCILGYVLIRKNVWLNNIVQNENS